ncbi:MAG: hypothetical protein GF311_24755 [Candidatus Lokiarchaeota archaeon]|nr:hypothetical protein [Candidatus Lokiarchaeota archaeon]
MTNRKPKEKIERKSKRGRKRNKDKEKETHQEEFERKSEKNTGKYSEGININKKKPPLIKLEEPKFNKKEFKLYMGIPLIKKVTRNFSIPIIEKSNSNIENRDYLLNNQIPEIKPHIPKSYLPFIHLQKHKKLSPISKEFNDQIPQIQSKETVLQLPIFKKLNKSKLKSKIECFDSAINNFLLEISYKNNSKLYERKSLNQKNLRLNDNENRLEFFKTKNDKLKEERTESHTKRKNAESRFEGGEGSSPNREFPYDFSKVLFNMPSNSLTSEGQKIILYKELKDDSTLGSFETLCIRIYREKEGGKPDYKEFNKSDDFNKEELEKWIKAENKIITVNLDGEGFKEWFQRANLRELLSREILGNLGFIIFKTNNAESYEGYKRILEQLLHQSRHKLDILYIKPEKILTEEKKVIAELVWGNLKIESKENELEGLMYSESKKSRVIGGTLDDIFNKRLKSEFEERLSRLQYENKSVYSNATDPHEGSKEESLEHKRIKWFLVKILTKKLINNNKLKENPNSAEIRDKILTEENIPSRNEEKKKICEVVADVMVPFIEEVYEVETLFAEERNGKIVSEKLNKTIEKYTNCPKVKKINIVLENYTFLRHLKTLKNIKRNRSKAERERIKFFTLDLKNNKLMSYKQVVNRLKSIYNYNDEKI